MINNDSWCWISVSPHAPGLKALLIPVGFWVLVTLKLLKGIFDLIFFHPWGLRLVLWWKRSVCHAAAAIAVELSGHGSWAEVQLFGHCSPVPGCGSLSRLSAIQHQHEKNKLDNRASHSGPWHVIIMIMKTSLWLRLCASTSGRSLHIPMPRHLLWCNLLGMGTRTTEELRKILLRMWEWQRKQQVMARCYPMSHDTGSEVNPPSHIHINVPSCFLSLQRGN